MVKIDEFPRGKLLDWAVTKSIITWKYIYGKYRVCACVFYFNVQMMKASFLTLLFFIGDAGIYSTLCQYVPLWNVCTVWCAFFRCVYFIHDKCFIWFNYPYLRCPTGIMALLWLPGSCEVILKDMGKIESALETLDISLSNVTRY